MAINYFTRACVSFLPSIFLPGKAVYISRFPSFTERYSVFIDGLAGCRFEYAAFDWDSLIEKPGWYVVDSVINYRDGVTEIGLEIGEDVQYYALSDIDITDIAPSSGAGSARLDGAMPVM